MRMVTPRLLIATCAVALVAGSLAACTPSAPTPTRTPIATHSQAFASDADALKAATEAYAAYLKMSDTIAQEGGANPERIKPFVTASWLSKEVQGFKALHRGGLHQTGATTFAAPKLQKHTGNESRGEVDIYVCVDASDTEIVNVSGQNVTPPNRPEIVASVATLVSNAPGSGQELILENYEPWSGTSFC
jgi:hypothetical protein